MKVGFIGLGQMGSAMAGNLVKAEALAGEGARVAATVADAGLVE